jgi:hypothetical protein
VSVTASHRDPDALIDQVLAVGLCEPCRGVDLTDGQCRPAGAPDKSVAPKGEVRLDGDAPQPGLKPTNSNFTAGPIRSGNVDPRKACSSG